MATYLKVKNNVVTKAIVADASFISTYIDGEAGRWVEVADSTEYGIGWRYENDTLTPAKPYATWTWDSTDSQWVAPVSKPNTDNADDFVSWNDDTQQWDVTARVSE